MTGARVLLIDDEPGTCWALAHLLTREGFSCASAGSAAEAATLFAPGRYALVMLDAKLPDASGLDLAGRLRADDARVPILLVSGYYFRDDPAVTVALQQGRIQAFIAKPFAHERVLAAVHEALAGAAQ